MPINSLALELGIKYLKCFSTDLNATDYIEYLNFTIFYGPSDKDSPEYCFRVDYFFIGTFGSVLS